MIPAILQPQCVIYNTLAQRLPVLHALPVVGQTASAVLAEAETCQGSKSKPAQVHRNAPKPNPTIISLPLVENKWISLAGYETTSSTRNRHLFPTKTCASGQVGNLKKTQPSFKAEAYQHPPTSTIAHRYPLMHTVRVQKLFFHNSTNCREVLRPMYSQTAYQVLTTHPAHFLMVPFSNTVPSSRPYFLMTLRSWSMSNSSVASLPANIIMDFFPPGCSPQPLK